MMLIVITGTFLCVMMINVKLGALSIEADRIEREIDKNNEDIQAIHVEIEQKGPLVRDRATKLGMVTRDKTVVVQLRDNQVNNYSSSLEEANKAYEENLQH
jgi:hypothetical protein